MRYSSTTLSTTSKPLVLRWLTHFLQQPQEADLYEEIFGKFKLLSLLIGAVFKAGAEIKSITTEKNDFFTNFF